MNIQINNSSWIKAEEDDTGYFITAYDNAGNIFQVMDIKRRYLKGLLKDIRKLIEK